MPATFVAVTASGVHRADRVEKFFAKRPFQQIAHRTGSKRSQGKDVTDIKLRLHAEHDASMRKRAAQRRNLVALHLEVLILLFRQIGNQHGRLALDLDD